jgi:hypothetical protein
MRKKAAKRHLSVTSINGLIALGHSPEIELLLWCARAVGFDSLGPQMSSSAI